MSKKHVNPNFYTHTWSNNDRMKGTMEIDDNTFIISCHGGYLSENLRFPTYNKHMNKIGQSITQHINPRYKDISKVIKTDIYSKSSQSQIDIPRDVILYSPHIQGQTIHKEAFYNKKKLYESPTDTILCNGDISDLTKYVEGQTIENYILSGDNLYKWMSGIKHCKSGKWYQIMPFDSLNYEPEDLKHVLTLKQAIYFIVSFIERNKTFDDSWKDINDPSIRHNAINISVDWSILNTNMVDRGGKAINTNKSGAKASGPKKSVKKSVKKKSGAKASAAGGTDESKIKIILSFCMNGIPWNEADQRSKGIETRLGEMSLISKKVMPSLKNPSDLDITMPLAHKKTKKIQRQPFSDKRPSSVFNKVPLKKKNKSPSIRLPRRIYKKKTKKTH